MKARGYDPVRVWVCRDRMGVSAKFLLELLPLAGSIVGQLKEKLLPTVLMRDSLFQAAVSKVMV